MATHNAQLVLPARAALGEGALWDGRTQDLLWVDITGFAAHRFNPAQRTDRAYPVGTHVGTIVPDRAHSAVVALGRGLARLDLDTGAVASLGEPFEAENHRLNDGKCDPQGRLWVGGISLRSMTPTSSLWCVGPDLRAHVRLTGISCSNGLAWSHDGGTFHYIDTPTRCLDAFDFDGADGSIRHRRTVHRFTDGFPDGMTIDAEGGLWVALWDGWKVVRIDPASGRVTDEVRVPAQRVTSCAFGGPGLRTLYITTARIGLDAAGLESQPEAGGVFAADPGCAGVPALPFAL